ncbi:hypothetical protein, partial [Stieleria varia]|uniref:hypothetical protein n=1 Tax=Stieleria varia TaxID=2528005 RepID=UPI001E29DBCC
MAPLRPRAGGSKDDHWPSQVALVPLPLARGQWGDGLLWACGVVASQSDSPPARGRLESGQIERM